MKEKREKGRRERERERERIQSLTTHRPHCPVLRRFVDERRAGHFAGLASTAIAHKERVWTLELLTLPSAATVLSQRREAFDLIGQSTEEEGSRGFWEKRHVNQRSVGGAASIPSQGIVFFHEEIFGSCFQDRITVVHPSGSDHTSVQDVQICGCCDVAVDGRPEKLRENRIVGNERRARVTELQTCTAAQRLGHNPVLNQE